MQKPTPSQVASGAIAPAIVGPSKDMKDVYIVAGVVLILAVIIGAFWVYSPPGESITTPGASDKLNPAQASSSLKTTAPPLPEPATSIPLAASTPDVFHADISFEVGRRGLTDEGRTLLQQQAEFLKSNPDYGVLVQGYTDQQGSASYNKALGLKRAETVKTALLNAGVDEHRMKVVSLGEEGMPCADASDICRRMNRRVHLEIRKIGREHMAVSAAPTAAPAPDVTRAAATPDAPTDGSDSLMDGLTPAIDASTESIPAPLPESGTVQTDSR